MSALSPDLQQGSHRNPDAAPRSTVPVHQEPSEKLWREVGPVRPRDSTGVWVDRCFGEECGIFQWQEDGTGEFGGQIHLTLDTIIETHPEPGVAERTDGCDV
jgi:hypothetical protein